MKKWNHDNRHLADSSRRSVLVLLLLAGLLILTPGLQAQDTPSAAPIPGATAPADEATPSSDAPAAASLETMSALNDKAKLSNGDQISYRVVEEQKEPVLRTVTASGELDIPLVGRVTAAGKTCKELAYELKPLLEKQYFYHATVIVGVETLSVHPKGEVYLMGQVLKQGAVEIPADETLTVSKAILIVGGLADFADRRRVKLVHKKADGTSQTTIVDLVEILDKGHTDRDPVVQADDMIIVPQKLINF